MWEERWLWPEKPRYEQTDSEECKLVGEGGAHETIRIPNLDPPRLTELE